jgi:hypothetical protein
MEQCKEYMQEMNKKKGYDEVVVPWGRSVLLHRLLMLKREINMRTEVVYHERFEAD